MAQPRWRILGHSNEQREHSRHPTLADEIRHTLHSRPQGPKIPAMAQFFDNVNGQLTKLSPASSPDEDTLQVLLAEHPQLLGGEELDPNDPRRFLLLKREVHDQDSGYVDHLFVDQDGVLTLVEAKLGKNHEARRKVVGQLLDYASSAAASWTAKTLTGWLEERCEQDDLDPSAVFDEFETELSEPGQFWARVEDNLRAGNIRLIFACDGEVPVSLCRIVEFLNERMRPTEVLALEVKTLQSDDKTIFVSNVVGSTERARALKGKPRRPDAIRALIDNGTLEDGQELWLTLDELAGPKPDDKRDPRLRVVLKVSESGTPQFLYEPPGGDARSMPPSQIYHAIRREIDPSHTVSRATKVADRIERADGKLIEELCYETGAWGEGGD